MTQVELLRSGEMEVEAKFDQLNKVLVVDTGLAGPRVEMGQSQGTRVAATLFFTSSSNQVFFISWAPGDKYCNNTLPRRGVYWKISPKAKAICTPRLWQS